MTAVNIGHSVEVPSGTFFLSCAHGIEDKVPVNRQQFLMKYQGRELPIRLLFHKIDPQSRDDMALFFLPNVRMRPVYQLSENNPPIGTNVTAHGYPGNDLVTLPGQIIKSIYSYHAYAFNRIAPSGMSGGPLTRNSTNKIDGIIVTASTGGHSTVMMVSQIRKWLLPLIKRMPIDRLATVEEKPIAPNLPKEPSPQPKVTVPVIIAPPKTKDWGAVFTSALEEQRSERDKLIDQLQGKAETRHTSMMDMITSLSDKFQTLNVRDLSEAKSVGGIAAFLATTAGLSAVSATGVGIAVPISLWLYRRRKKRKQREQPVQDDSKIDGIIEYLKDNEATMKRLLETTKGVVVRETLTEDGVTTREEYWKDGVMLAKSGDPKINVLGGPAVGREIESYVRDRIVKNLDKESSNG